MFLMQEQSKRKGSALEKLDKRMTNRDMLKKQHGEEKEVAQNFIAICNQFCSSISKHS